ncbi:iron chaperone [Streptomyces sp. NPDC048751]|uniref:iron chaperone n=1 Tax=Streptomyces sp. NPDC048751 TaxID=3365591 RepID=UPI0037230789
MASAENSTYEGFTAEERAAMKEHAQEQKKAARRGSRADKAAEAERDVLAKIAEMQDSDRIMAERVHAVVKANAPVLAPKLWYGMPAYALDGRVVCFFQSAAKFKARYATLGFNDAAKLDEGSMWATAFALTEVTDEVEARIAALVKQAVS